MNSLLPNFRSEVSISVHTAESEQMLILNDPYGIADGPIMLHPDMVHILEHCDGETSWEAFADAMGIPADSAEIANARMFIRQLDTMGYFETPRLAELRTRMENAWNSSSLRPPVCAGSTYPADPDELKQLLDTMDSLNSQPAQPCSAALVPHIDFRVAGQAYAHGLQAIRGLNADIVFMIGTSHYWADTMVILTNKSYTTPLGTLQTDTHVVDELRTELLGKGLGLASTDVAHKPEHSLELHAVLLQHVYPSRPIRVVPVLVADTGLDPNEAARQMQAVAEACRTVAGRCTGKVGWLISGDMSHYGLRFGHNQAAETMVQGVHDTDAELLNLLASGDTSSFHTRISNSGNYTNICGYVPLMVGLQACNAGTGTTMHHALWNDAETGSAVSFAVMSW